MFVRRRMRIGDQKVSMCNQLLPNDWVSKCSGKLPKWKRSNKNKMEGKLNACNFWRLFTNNTQSTYKWCSIASYPGSFPGMGKAWVRGVKEQEPGYEARCLIQWEFIFSSPCAMLQCDCHIQMVLNSIVPRLLPRHGEEPGYEARCSIQWMLQYTPCRKKIAS